MFTMYVLFESRELARRARRFFLDAGTPPDRVGLLDPGGGDGIEDILVNQGVTPNLAEDFAREVRGGAGVLSVELTPDNARETAALARVAERSARRTVVIYRPPPDRGRSPPGRAGAWTESRSRPREHEAETGSWSRS